MDVGCNKLYKRNNKSEDVLRVGNYFLSTSAGKTLVLYEMLFVLGMPHDFLSLYHLACDGFDRQFYT